jgi:hypothetical protein
MSFGFMAAQLFDRSKTASTVGGVGWGGVGWGGVGWGGVGAQLVRVFWGVSSVLHIYVQECRRAVCYTCAMSPLAYTIEE